MSDDNQTPLPPSFIALFVPSGRSRPNATREHIAARYELCEDLANLLTEPAQTQLWSLGVTEADILARIHAGLLTGEAGLDAAEAGWVTSRLAELLNWDRAWPGGGPDDAG
jgi:hypothetical protein